MRIRKFAFGLLFLGLLAFCGCKRSSKELPASAGQYGVKVDVARLDTEFANASPEAQQHVAVLKHAFRYSQLSQAATELDALANTPDLTPPQKQLVDQLIKQTKQTIANAPPNEK